METIKKIISYKSNLENIKFIIEPGYASQGECVVRFPTTDIKIEMDIATTSVIAIKPKSETIMVLGKIFPAPGKTMVLMTFKIKENEQIIFTETYEKTLDAFDRFSYIFSLVKSK